MEAPPPHSVTPQPRAPRSNAPAWIAFALPPLACALWLAWAVYRVGNAEADTGLAYDTVVQGLGGAVVAGVVAVAVLVWAALRGHIAYALLGLLAGSALAPLVLWFGMGAVLSSRRHDFERRQQQVQALAGVIRSGDAARIRAAIDALPERPGPARALCMLQGRESYRLVNWLWFDERGYGPNLPSDELLAAAAAVVDGPAPVPDKQASLRVVLRALADRGEAQRFAAWAALWRRTLPQPAPQPVLLTAPAEEYGDCTLGDPLERVLREWRDDGVRAWLDAGFGFERGRSQTTVALRALRRADTLRALLAADPQFAALLREDRDAGEDALSAQADALSATLDAAPEPAQSVELIEALHAAGAQPRVIGPVTACELFERNEQRRDLARDTPQRQAAVSRVRAVLCPAEAKAAKRAFAKKTTK
ncbi:hypothetical protein A7A76_24350 [Lysobacter enzymogenes]|uniref:hypothetical protein n=1 Tax=Lysobacter enzymogenes TaxID=69 RepID=UPI0019D27B99|nr:hypothetical protein [Lysobacter enzymogenes]MBN7137819.1 hypothetical protein [Lysobacter enzymogenes]